jgi:hypothetical protein
MPIIINTTTVIAVATFLWYRKGRLWNFYDSLLSQSLEQIKVNSIDRKRWEQIALEHSRKLSNELFNSTFRFEIEYLEDKIIKNQYLLWISDSSATNEREIRYTDKGKYCKHIFKEVFLADFRFCGLGLFIKSIKHHVCKKEDPDRGYIERNLR